MNPKVPGELKSRKVNRPYNFPRTRGGTYWGCPPEVLVTGGVSVEKTPIVSPGLGGEKSGKRVISGFVAGLGGIALTIQNTFNEFDFL